MGKIDISSALHYYIDLSTVCHRYLGQSESGDFVLYYFEHQYAWNFSPEDSREKVKPKLVAMAAKYRRKHPDRNLKVMFWPKAALDAFRGMNQFGVWVLPRTKP